MTTLAEMRTRVRLRLEDTTENPIWSDGALDEGLRMALDSYTWWSPEEKTATIVASAGDTVLALPADSVGVARVVAPWGGIIPRRAYPIRSVVAEELAWESWSGDLRFSRALTAGEYTVDYLADRVMPAEDEDPFPVPPGDEGLIVVDAVLAALDLRAVEEWKRGPVPARYSTVLGRARAESQRLWRERRGRIRTRTVDVSG